MLTCVPAVRACRPQRRRLVAHWQQSLQDDLLCALRRRMELYAGCMERLRRVHAASNLEVCRTVGGRRGAC